MALEEINVEKIETLEEAVSIIKILIAEVLSLRAENLELKKENSELKNQIAALKKNSSTSSKPPSSDIVKPESQAQGSRKRKIGGQPGHTGKSRKMFPPEQVDTTIECCVSACPDCGSDVERSRETESLIHQVAEFVAKPLIVTEYQRHAYWCANCQRQHYGRLPEE